MTTYSEPRIGRPVYVNDHGAAGDGTTDDTAAILDAYDYAAATGRTVHWLAGTYRTTGTLAPPPGVETYMATGAVLAYEGAGIAVDLDGWSGAFVNDPIGRSTFSVRRKVAQWASGADTTSIGIRFNRINSCHFDIPLVANFHTGLLMTAEGEGAFGTCYNTFDLGYIRDNKRNIQYSTGPAGWVNSNTYVGGHVRHSSGAASYVGTVGFSAVDATPGSYNNGNNDTFLNVCWEGRNTETTVDVRGVGAQFVGGSWEDCAPGSVRIARTATGTMFVGGYGNEGPGAAIFSNLGLRTVIIGARGMSSCSDSSSSAPQGGGAAAFDAIATFGGGDLLFRGRGVTGIRQWTLDAGGRSQHWYASTDTHPTIQIDGKLVKGPGAGANYCGAISFGRGNATQDAHLARTTTGTPGIVSNVPILGRTIVLAHSMAGALTLAMPLAEVAIVTLGADVTTIALSDGVTDAVHTQTITVMLVQDATGSRTLGTVPKAAFAGGTVPTLTTTPGKRDVFTFCWDSAAAKWIETSRSMNI